MTPPPDKSVPPIRAVRIAAKCPVCTKPGDEKYRPFCSKRCADVDLGRWLKEGYPTQERPEDGETPPDGASGQDG